MQSARSFAARQRPDPPIIALAAILIGSAALAGCGMPGAPQPPSLNLPNRVSNLTAVRNGDQVSLTWKMPVRTTDKVTLRAPVSARICRNESNSAPCDPVTTLRFAPGADVSFADALSPTLASGSPRQITYFIELVNRKGRSAGLSNGSKILAGTAPPPVDDLSAEVRRDGVLLHWSSAPTATPPADIRLVRTLLTPHAEKAGPGQLSAPSEPAQRNLLVQAGASGRALDNDIRFGETYEYRAQRVVRISENEQTLELASSLSAPVRVEAINVFPPSIPQGLAAVANSNPPTIDLSWQPVSDADLAGYIVYRREADSAEWQHISPAQPVTGPGFHDTNVQAGHAYRYAVTSIGQNGHESMRSPEVQETVPEP
jgi:hypothetical protein